MVSEEKVLTLRLYAKQLEAMAVAIVQVQQEVEDADQALQNIEERISRCDEAMRCEDDHPQSETTTAQRPTASLDGLATGE